MADRNNIEDIYKIVKEDFDWIIEDMEQHIYLIKENMVEFIKKIIHLKALKIFKER